MLTSSTFPYGTTPVHGHNERYTGPNGQSISREQTINFPFKPFSGTTFSQFNDEMVNFGTGVSTSNFTNVSVNFLWVFNDRFAPTGTRREMLVFVDRTVLSPKLKLAIGHQMPSIHSLNQYLVSPEGRALYGRERCCDKLMQDFGFAGSLNTEVPEYRYKAAPDQEVNVIVGRRARCSAVTRSCVHKQDLRIDTQLNTVWLVVVRRKFTPDDTLVQGTNVAFDVPDKHYWQFHVYTTEESGLVKPWLYCDDESTGACVRVGMLVDYTPPNHINPVEVEEIRKSLDGKYNFMKKPYGFIDLIERKPTCDIFLL